MAKYPMSARRRIAIASYKPPRDGIIYGALTLDCSQVVRYLDEKSVEPGKKVTITAFMGAIVGRALRAEPTLNGRIHLGRFIPYTDVNVAFLVQVDGGDNLAQVKVPDIDKMSPAQVSAYLAEKADAIRRGKDENFEKSIALTRRMPTPILRRVLSFGGFMTTGMGKGFAGQPAFPFGSAVISSVGMLGVDEALIPPTPFLRVPLYVGIGSIHDMVFAEEGQPVVKPGITVTATLDHRFVDGYQAATISRIVREAFQNPWVLDTPAS